MLNFAKLKLWPLMCEFEKVCMVDFQSNNVFVNTYLLNIWIHKSKDKTYKEYTFTVVLPGTVKLQVHIIE